MHGPTANQNFTNNFTGMSCFQSIEESKFGKLFYRE